MKLLSFLATSAVLLTATATAPVVANAGMMGAHPMMSKEFTLAAQNGSKENGTVTLTGMPGGKTLVVVKVSNPGAAPEPAHIHPGPCAKLDPAPKYPLTALVGGMSKTIVPAPINSLTGHDFVVNVHKSAQEAATYVSCGDLT